MSRSNFEGDFMDSKIETPTATAVAIARAHAALRDTRIRAITLHADIRAAKIAHCALIARAAAGDEPTESEWDVSESKIARLGRLADRFTAILGLQDRVINAVKEAAGEVAGGAS